MLGHTFGLVELAEGTVEGTRIELASIDRSAAAPRPRRSPPSSAASRSTATCCATRCASPPSASPSSTTSRPSSTGRPLGPRRCRPPISARPSSKDSGARYGGPERRAEGSRVSHRPSSMDSSGRHARLQRVRVNGSGACTLGRGRRTAIGEAGPVASLAMPRGRHGEGAGAPDRRRRRGPAGARRGDRRGAARDPPRRPPRDDDDADAGPRLRAGRRAVPHRRPPGRGAGAARPLLHAGGVGGGQRVQRGHGRDRPPGAGADGSADHHDLVVRAVRFRVARRPPPAARPAATPRAVPARRPRRRCPDRIHDEQRLFATTGGVHAAAAFDRAGRAGGACGRTSAATTPSTRSSAGCCSTSDCRRPTSPSTSAGGRRSRSCRRRGRPASPPSSPCRPRPSSPSTPPGHGELTLAGFARGRRINVYAPADLDGAWA